MIDLSFFDEKQIVAVVVPETVDLISLQNGFDGNSVKTSFINDENAAVVIGKYWN